MPAPEEEASVQRVPGGLYECWIIATTNRPPSPPVSQWGASEPDRIEPISLRHYNLDPLAQIWGEYIVDGAMVDSGPMEPRGPYTLASSTYARPRLDLSAPGSNDNSYLRGHMR
jgi:hypothetical protein